MIARNLLMGTLTAVAAAACGSGADTFTQTGYQDCSTDIVAKFTPGDTTVSVGATYTEHIALSTCSGTRSIVDSFTWSSNDPSVLTIDDATGVTKAVKAGTARVTAIGAFYGSYVGSTITVK